MESLNRTNQFEMIDIILRSGSRSIGRNNPVDPADPRNGTRRSSGSDRIVWHVPERRSKSIKYALATYWRRISIRITAAVSNCVAKMSQFVMNLMSLYRNQLHPYDFLLSFQSTDIPDLHVVQSACALYISWQKQIGSLYYVAGSDRNVPLQHQDRSGTFLPLERGPDWN